MSEREDGDEPVTERVVREAVEKGLETSMRETIVEAVEESQETEGSRRRRFTIAGALAATGAAVGYLLGSRRGTDRSEEGLVEVDTDGEPTTEDEPMADEEATIDDVDEEQTVDDEEQTADDEEATIDEEDGTSGGSRLRRLLVAAGVVGALVYLRRRLGGEDGERWEPIEEFEPAVSQEPETPFAGDEGDSPDAGPGATEVGSETTEGDSETTEVGSESSDEPAGSESGS